MRKEGSLWKQLLTATPRLLLALLISLVIAKPLELKIFEKEIGEELLVMHQEKKKQQEELIRGRYEADRNLAENQIQSLQNEINQKAAIRDDLARIAREEADGTGGTMQRNAGPIYKIKKADADRAEAEFNEISKRNEGLIAEQRTRLVSLDSSMLADRAAMNAEVADGPAARMDALSRLTAKSSAIWMANIFIILLFLAVETAPIFVKLISHKGPYDNQIRVVEYPFETNRVEKLARTTAEIRERTSDLPDFDRKHANDKLDVLLKSG
jgi:hypothetical protein